MYDSGLTVDLTTQTLAFSYIHNFQMIIKRAFVEARPLQIVSVGLTAASAFYAAKLGLRELRGETEDVTG